MRLKHIQLAGFKSFVDPVTIPAPARLTGVVGPNGCGKSNVIDAVRWVLGESKARELRGESMQDVIFNGSANRKPASRASVEMVFDNSEGRAAGQWSQYAEIAVKRVLTRQGESIYYINNVKVRRKDMHDLFLGTGLGGDAYAIIEQGMISRVIESKPEELRGYLEEAAGVSKYKERRKETEYRLRDTRENLSRVDDIRAELGVQLDKLTVQAEVARRYFALDADRTLKIRHLAMTRKQDARLKQAESERQIEATRIEIEAKIAQLRKLESDLETERLAQFEATEALNQAQAQFYAQSGEVARVEQELKHLHETRERLAEELRLTGLRGEQAHLDLNATHEEINLRRSEHDQAEEQAAILAERAAETGLNVPSAEQAWREAQAAVASAQSEVGRHEQNAQIEESHIAHADRIMEQLKARELRLIQEREGLATLDESGLARQEAEIEETHARIASLGEYLASARAELPDLEAAVNQAHQVRELGRREVARLEAELAALNTLQMAAHQSESEGVAWLARVGLENAPRLWQGLRVESGWETAVEAALGEAMAAMAVEAAEGWLTEPPEARFEFALAAAPQAESLFALLPAETGFRPLSDLIHCTDPLVARFLNDRLALAYAADTLDIALQRRVDLPPGGFVATREGHRLSRDTVVFNAPEKGHHGLIARVREIEGVEENLAAAHERLGEIDLDVATAEETLLAGRRQTEALLTQQQQTQAQAHTLQMHLVRSQEAAKRVADRRAQIDRELDELYAQLDIESESWNEASERLREAQEETDRARTHLDEMRHARQAADQHFQALRETQRRADRESQEAAFQVRSLTGRLQELAERVTRAERAIQDLTETQARLEAQLAEASEVPINESLVRALEQRQSAEVALTAAREALEGANAKLQTMEGERLKTERALEPLKDRAQAMELKLQEARLLETRFEEELSGVNLDALALETAAAGLMGRSEAWLRSEIERLDRDVEALGPVNMAALQELEATQQRKNYLDEQALDLATAAETLEEAIRRIDAETRARLKETFEQVSREFRSLFTELFGGGEAQLMLTGEEILDAGLAVMAQPPGKRNSSIHLLSGGEKALTALSLVFAFFRLNPAPFCLLDEVDAPLDDSNAERLCRLIKKMAEETQFMFITHNRITMELAQHLVGITMPEPGVSRPVAVDVEDALRLAEAA